MSTDAHAEALKAYIAAAAKAPAHDLDELQKMTAKPARYVEVYLSRRFGGPQRYDGTRDNNLRRLSTRVVADSITNGRLIEDRISDAFAYATVDLGDTRVLVEFESGGGDFEWDSGAWTSQLTDWTFGI